MLSWISLGSPLEFIGAPRNIQGAVDSYVYGDRAPGLLKLLIIGCGNQAVNIDSGVCSGGQGHHQGATNTTQWCGSMKTRPASWTSSPCLCKNGSIMEKSIQVAASHCSLIYTSFTQSLRPLCLHRKTIKPHDIFFISNVQYAHFWNWYWSMKPVNGSPWCPCHRWENIAIMSAGGQPL